MSDTATGGTGRMRWWLGALALVLAFAVSATSRIHFALRDPGFRSGGAAALLRTDPAFLYYVTERIADAGGVAPADLRADPNVEWPEITDIAAIETVGQEYVVAWAWLATGKALPLHRTAVWVMGLWASLVVIGVFGAAWELSRRVEWAAVAAWLWAAMLVDYRTLGFVFIREDFAFPWIAAHLWLALRAARTRSARDFVLAGVTLAASAAFWHAALFILLIEAVALFAWFLRSGGNPMGAARAWLVLATAAVVSLAFPVLRSKLFVLSLPMLIGYALLWAAWIGRKTTPTRGKLALHGVAALVALIALSKLTAQWLGGGEDYSHVFKLLLAKLTHLGQPPADPRTLDFDVRLLWQGPFRTAELGPLVAGAWAALIALIATVALEGKTWLRGEGDGRVAVALLFALACAVASWMVERTAPLLGLSGAILAAVALSRLRSAKVAAAIACVAVVAHGAHQVYMPSKYPIAWYQLPPSAQENAHVLRFVEANVPQGEAVAADYSTSAAVLAFARRPILNQPKYETRRSRERIRELCDALYGGSPEQLAAYLRSQRCRWLLVNRAFVGGNATDLGGILPADLPRLQGRAILGLMSENPAEYRRVGPLQLVYEAPREVGGRAYRLYRLDG